MIISVASGKGGTGKTTVSTSLALSIEEDNIQFVDCDVEEPNSFIFLKPENVEKIEATVLVPEIDKNKCTFCGLCQEVCEYNALVVLKDNVMVLPELCHSCGGCSLLCPEKAISEVDRGIGVIEHGRKENIEIVYGRLNIGEAMPVPLIKMVKKYIKKENTVIIDAPPGTSCPVIEAVKDSDYCILVTEPTPFGLNDLKLAVGVMRELNKPFGIIINRFGIGDKGIEQYCSEEDIPILLKIPFEREIAVGYSKGIPLVELNPKYKEEFRKIYNTISNVVKNNIESKLINER